MSEITYKDRKSKGTNRTTFNEVVSKIPGTYNEGYKAMGDGVAAPVARWLATKLLSPLLEAYHES